MIRSVSRLFGLEESRSRKKTFSSIEGTDNEHSNDSRSGKFYRKYENFVSKCDRISNNSSIILISCIYFEGKKCRRRDEEDDNIHHDPTWKDSDANESSEIDDGNYPPDDDQVSLSTNDQTEQASIGSLTPLHDFFNSLAFERLQQSMLSSSSNKDQHSKTANGIEESCFRKQQNFWNSQETINHQKNTSVPEVDFLPPVPEEKSSVRRSKTADISAMWGWFVHTDDK